MTATFDLLLKDLKIVSTTHIAEGDIGIRDGKIACIASDIASARAGKTMNCKGLHALPGLIDTHVHFREPGAPQKEDFESGSRAAVLGGVTSIFDMPNTTPPTINESGIEEKIRRAHGRMYCHFAFWVGATQANISHLAALENLPGVAGIKIFMGSSTGDLLLSEDEDIAAAFAQVRRRIALHCEDEVRLGSRKFLQRVGDAATHSLWRDDESACQAVRRAIHLARQQEIQIHVLHVSTALELEFLAQYRKVASVEITPHHLTFCTDDYERLGTQIQMNPPIRSRPDVLACWKALGQGRVDSIGSDHAPHLLSEKALPYPQSPSGMPGVQTTLSILLDNVARQRLSVEQVVALTSTGPAELFHLPQKGKLLEGYDADITLVDLKRQQKIEESWLQSRCGWSPYTGKTIQGWPVATFIKGQNIMWNNEIVSPPGGEMLRFEATNRL